MKNLLAILLLGISSISFAQDTTKIPTDELETYFQAMDELREQDSLKHVLIQHLQEEIKYWETLDDENDLIISYKDQEILLLNEQIDLHLDRLDKVDKWYNKPMVGFVGGFLDTIVLIHTIDYTLPQ